MRRQRGPLCNDDAADCVGPSVLAPRVPPPGTYPPTPLPSPPHSLRRCEPMRSGLRRSAVKSSAAPLRYKAPFDVRSHVWSSSGCCCLLCGGISSVQIHPLFHFHEMLFIFLFFLVGRGWSGRIATFFLALHKNHKIETQPHNSVHRPYFFKLYLNRVSHAPSPVLGCTNINVSLSVLYCLIKVPMLCPQLTLKKLVTMLQSVKDKKKNERRKERKLHISTNVQRKWTE